MPRSRTSSEAKEKQVIFLDAGGARGDYEGGASGERPAGVTRFSTAGFDLLPDGTPGGVSLWGRVLSTPGHPAGYAAIGTMKWFTSARTPSANSVHSPAETSSLGPA